MAKAIPEGYHSLTPFFVFKDSKKAIAFYEKAFGAKQKYVMPRPGGKGVMHAELTIGDSALMLGDESPDQPCKSAETLGDSPIKFYVYVEDADRSFKKAVDAGCKSEMPVQEMFWGDRVGNVKDPFGYSWSFATHTKDLTPDEIQRGAETFYAQMAHK